MGAEQTEGAPKPDLSQVTRKEVYISDYLLPVPESPFAVALPDNRRPDQPDELFDVLQRNVRSDIRRFDSEVVILGESDSPQLALQLVSESLVAREFIGAPSDPLVDKIKAAIPPAAFDDMIARAASVDPTIPIVSGWSANTEVSRLRHANESYRALSHVIRQAPSGSVRIEMHEVESAVEYDADGNPLRIPRLDSSIFTCSLNQDEEGPESIKVTAVLPWDDDESGDRVETTFILRPDGIHVPEEELLRLIEQAGEKRIWMRYGTSSPDILPTFWSEISHSIIVRDDSKKGVYGHPNGDYVLGAFGQELSADHSGYAKEYKSIRIFDSSFAAPTVRSQDEVDAEIYLTVEEAATQRDQMAEFKRHWREVLVPMFKDWTPEQIATAAEYITTHRRDISEVLRERLQGDTRLAIIGMTQHPHFDHLPFNIIEDVEGVDFIALDLRPLGEQDRALKEDTEGMTDITLDTGMVVRMPHDQAKREFPEQYRDPNDRDTSYDNVIAEARKRDITVLYVRQGDTWADANRSAADTIARYMQEHPEAKGTYFTSVYGAMKWPGYADEDERDAIGFSRPLTTQSVFEDQPQNDPPVQMPAFALEAQFPGQVYSTAQFVMPRGFGQDWKNLRAATEESGVKERFALDDLANTPFAVQRYMFRGIVELADVPDEDLCDYFGTMAHGFFGPIEFQWGKVFDGVIVNPSDEELPPEPTPEEIAASVAEVISGTIQ